MCAKGHELERFLAMTTNGSIQSIPANWAASTFTRSAITLPGYCYTLAARTTAPRKKPTRAALICLLHIERKMLILFDRPLCKERSQVRQLCFYALPDDEGFCFPMHSHFLTRWVSSIKKSSDSRSLYVKKRKQYAIKVSATSPRKDVVEPEDIYAQHTCPIKKKRRTKPVEEEI